MTVSAGRCRHRLPLMIGLALGVSVLLHLAAVPYWYVPFAVVAAHVAIVAGLVLLVRLITRGSVSEVGTLVRRPRLYDWVVRVVSLGRERKWRGRMLDLAALGPGDRVLDVGCGTGTLLTAAFDRVGPTGQLHGVEPSVEMVSHARRKAEARGVPVEIVMADSSRLPYPDASFDAVLCTMVLHHMRPADQTAAVSEMRRVLRPGGRIVIVDLARPRTPARAVRAAASLVSLLHGCGSGSTSWKVIDVAPLLGELGLREMRSIPFGSGAVGAVVGRLS